VSSEDSTALPDSVESTTVDVTSTTLVELKYRLLFNKSVSSSNSAGIKLTTKITHDINVIATTILRGLRIYGITSF
jgi:hypothetical protein